MIELDMPMTLGAQSSQTGSPYRKEGSRKLHPSILSPMVSVFSMVAVVSGHMIIASLQLGLDIGCI